MDAPKTINIAPSPAYMAEAFKHFGIELGGALKVRPDGEGLSVDTDAPDFTDVLSKLSGLVLEAHAVATMVIPSNVDGLRNADRLLRDVEGAAKDRIPEGDLASLQDARESIQGISTNLDGLLAPKS